MLRRPRHRFRLKVLLFMLPLLLPIGGAGRDATGDPADRAFRGPGTSPTAALSVTAPLADVPGSRPVGEPVE